MGILRKATHGGCWQRNKDGTTTLLPWHFNNVAAASVEYSRATCSASMQHVSEQKENKVSWLDQLGSWWDKNGTTIITGAIAVGVGALAITTVIATAGTALPILAATSSTLAALAGATVATAGTIAMMTGTASILSTLPGLDKVYGPTVNTAGFQELQMVSVVVASMGTQYLWMLDSVAQSANAQTPKTQEQTSTKVKEEITGTENAAGENAGQVQGTEESKILYRGERSSVDPDTVFKNGFQPKGTGTDLEQHVTSNTTAGNFISTSSSEKIADDFAGKNGYVYEIETSSYVDVNEILGSKSPYPEQMEFAIPGGVSSEQIKGAWVMRNGVRTGEFIPNPQFKGGK